MHPILDALDNTEHEWIKKLLFTFNEGNIGKFEALAPLFPKEVCLNRRYIIRGVAADLRRRRVCERAADSSGELPVPATEDLPDGAH